MALVNVGSLSDNLRHLVGERSKRLFGTLGARLGHAKIANKVLFISAFHEPVHKKVGDMHSIFAYKSLYKYS